jgi:recombination protein RecR
MHKYPDELMALITHLKKLPGVGLRTAERFAFELLNWSESELGQFGHLVSSLRSKVPPCSNCGCLTQEGMCHFCNSPNRDSSALCLIASPRDAYAIEQTKNYRGLYHVVEHLLSPLDGRNTNALRIDRIEVRLTGVQELIIAFDSTLEADTTALFLKNRLARPGLAISRLAFGLPVGSSLEYIDGGTLSRAFVGRQNLH